MGTAGLSSYCASERLERWKVTIFKEMMFCEPNMIKTESSANTACSMSCGDIGHCHAPPEHGSRKHRIECFDAIGSFRCRYLRTVVGQNKLGFRYAD